MEHVHLYHQGLYTGKVPGNHCASFFGVAFTSKPHNLYSSLFPRFHIAGPIAICFLIDDRSPASVAFLPMVAPRKISTRRAREHTQSIHVDLLVFQQSCLSGVHFLHHRCEAVRYEYMLERARVAPDLFGSLHPLSHSGGLHFSASLPLVASRI